MPLDNTTKAAAAEHMQKNLSVVKEDGSPAAPAEKAAPQADAPVDLSDDQKAILDELYPTPKEEPAAAAADPRDEAIRAMQREIEELKRARPSAPQVERPTQAAGGANPQAAVPQSDPEVEALLRIHPELEPVLRKVTSLEARTAAQQAMAEQALGAVRERENETMERQMQQALDEVQRKYPLMDQDQVIGQMVRRRADVTHLETFAKASHNANFKRDRAAVEAAFKRARAGAKLVSGKVAPSGGSKPPSTTEQPPQVLDLKKDGNKLLDKAMRLIRGGADKS